MAEINTIELIRHPENLNKDTLFALRSLLAHYPYYQTARLLFLRNLYFLHDPSFDEELRKASLFVADRRVLFYMVEGENYKMEPAVRQSSPMDGEPSTDRTFSLIDQFLTETHLDEEEKPEEKKQPTVTDVKTDYTSYLLQLDDIYPVEEETTEENRGQSLIDDFIQHKPERIVLQENPSHELEVPELTDDGEDSCLTETLAKIYIKQGRYERAIEIIRSLSANYPKKNSYFADQIRFLEKLVINNKNKK